MKSKQVWMKSLAYGFRWNQIRLSLTLQSKISSRSDFIHHRWIYSAVGGFNWKNDKSKLVVFSGGADGNWTRVQRPLDITFSVGSQSIKASLIATPTDRLRISVSSLCMTDTEETLGSCSLLIWRTVRAVVLSHGTGGVSAASQLTLQEQQFCCRLLFKLDIIRGYPARHAYHASKSLSKPLRPHKVFIF